MSGVVWWCGRVVVWWCGAYSGWGESDSVGLHTDTQLALVGVKLHHWTGEHMQRLQYRTTLLCSTGRHYCVVQDDITL